MTIELARKLSPAYTLRTELPAASASAIVLSITVLNALIPPTNNSTSSANPVVDERTVFAFGNSCDSPSLLWRSVNVTESGIAVGIIVGSGSSVGTIVGTGVSVGTIVGIGVSVGTIVGIGVSVGTIVGTGVSVGIGVGVGSASNVIE